jgi:molybdate transport system substrate-binding protein
MKLRVVLIVVVLIVAALLLWPRDQTPAERPLVCYVGGTMQPVFEALARAYQEKTGKQIDITSAGSGELMATIEMQQEGDLYVCHDPFMDILMKRGLGVNAWRVAEIFPVLIFRKGNPKHIQSLKDLQLPDVKVYLTDYRHSTLGHMLPTIFERAGINFAELNEKKKIETHRAGAQVANLLIMEQCDAALVWQAVAHLRKEDLDIIRIDDALPRPDVDMITSATGKEYPLMPVKVTISSLSCSERQADGERFVEFVVSDDGRQIVGDHGFKVTDQTGRREYINGVKVP